MKILRFIVAAALSCSALQASMVDLKLSGGELSSITGILQAKVNQIAGGIGPVVTVNPTGGGSKPASYDGGININLEALKKEYGKDFNPTSLNGLHSGYAIGLIEAHLRHEMMHDCCDSHVNGTQGRTNSCAHYNIERQMHDEMCAAICELIALGNAEAVDYALGMCAYLKKWRGYWAKDDRRKYHAWRCATGTGPPPTPDNCPVENDCPQSGRPAPGPPGSPMPAGWQPIPKCPCCP